MNPCINTAFFIIIFYYFTLFSMCNMRQFEYEFLNMYVFIHTHLGTRLMGGKDAASPRYVFTKLENITRCIFHPHDDPLLDYLDDDGG